MMRRDKRFDDLYRLYEERKEAIQQRLHEFKAVPPSEYFYEMAYCLLTPQTSARSAAEAVDHLKKHRFRSRETDPLGYLRGKGYYIRFHHTKAKRLRKLKESFSDAMRVLVDTGLPAFDKRTALVGIIDGFGLKEATHFLRNVGLNDGLAILDRHILKKLYHYRAIDAVPVSLPKSRYYAIERDFLAFSEMCGIPVDELDLLFWSMETGIILK
jgi:N-glycosylase/DNA lyase